MAHSNTPTLSHTRGDDSAHQHTHPLVGHLVPIWLFMAVGGTLLMLTVITVAVRYIDVGEFNIVIALGVAAIKATLVALFFMHLRWDRPFNLLVFLASIVFVILMMSFCMMDTAQYRSQQFVGNAPDVESTLQSNAPGAPVARFKPYTP